MQTQPIVLTSEHVGILSHTLRRAMRQLFCGDSPEMRDLVAAGLMVSRGRVSWCPSEYFTITDLGRDELRKFEERN